MKVGAEPRKVVILAALLIVGVIILYFNVFAGDSEPKTPAVRVSPAVSVPIVTALGVPAAERAERRRSAKNGVTQEFKFREGTPPGEDKPDPATIDPTLRLDLLAKLQKVDLPASLRNIFQYGAAPPPPTAAKPVELPKNTPKIAINNQPPPKPTGPPPAPPAPSAPQMTFKYYGYKVSKSDGRKQAFLLDGEDIIIAGENDSVKLGRYKVVRIGVNSITIEDTQFKSTQTLQLQPDAVA
jgi:hypothetical protein